MKLSNQFSNSLVAVALLACAWVVTSIHGSDIEQRSFADPDDAIKALQAALEANDQTALIQLFGPEFHELMTGDPVQDANNHRRLASAMAQGCQQVKESEDMITIEAGTNSWPMPIPLVKADEKWHFDTGAGREEIINRHIGKDELHAIGVCRAYVTAQKQYGAANADADGKAVYAQKLKSTPGKKDGLYWATAENEPASPFGPLVAQAHAEGYGKNGARTLQPFHGYFFRILTRQGKAAPGGKMDYVSHDRLTGGFALVAYPARWDHSGIMTFIVNQDGKVYQRNLGDDTARIAVSMKSYNPDSKWTLVADEGVAGAVTGK